MNAVDQRLAEARRRTNHWKRWGPYLAERAWGTVREDYSANGTAWEYFPHDHARSRAYRWNEDGIGGVCDRHQKICIALALWNENDPILKERLFGLSGNEGNHGEDCKEYYYYLDSTPTHCYLKYLYKYPHVAYPYEQLIQVNRDRSRAEGEYELIDTGVFAENRYFDVQIEYAKTDPENLLMQITVSNRGPESANLRLLPTIWFRNRWSWGGPNPRPNLSAGRANDLGFSTIELAQEDYGRRWLYCEGADELLFTENETNAERLYGTTNPTPFVKDGIHNYIVNAQVDAVNPAQMGTKASAHYRLEIPAGGSKVVRLRFTDAPVAEPFDGSFAQIVNQRQAEADEFYAGIIPAELSDDARNVMRQSMAGLLWSKQYYHYVVRDWLKGDLGQPAPPAARLAGRNHEWGHLYNADVISMPDKWEFPWYAAWDLAFHCIPLALVDPDFAKDQLTLMLREWYMHPNGQLPAYEWALGDVNPPVHAWAALRVFRIDKKRNGVGDTAFLEKVFHKLLLNFTWWVNRKDEEGKNVFQGGFLGLDNIGVFDRGADLPTGGHLEQSDGTSWMAMYSLNLMAIALELANTDPAYEDVASKFWEHFIYIADAMNDLGEDGVALWDEEDGFYYDVLHLPTGEQVHMKVRSMVGLIPLFAVETLEADFHQKLPGFQKRMDWFIDNRPDLTDNIACMRTTGSSERRLMAILDQVKLRSVLEIMLDEAEFLSPFGLRAVSRIHEAEPYRVVVKGVEYRVDYDPGESSTGLFGGNSNWRGPIWFPLNYLIIEALQKFHYYLGDDFRVECPTGSGNMLTLWEVASELSRRLSRIFLRGEDGRRPFNGGVDKFDQDPHWRDLLQFYEYFHGDTGRGLGASHQTGWTGLVAKLLQQSGE
ncbi:MAG: glucosidase [Pyrinomonadaceae bacterium]